MKTFFTADWHLGEDRFEIMQRPFFSSDEHNAVLIRNHNSIVAPDDVVIMVGDACFTKDMLPKVSSFNGRKTLIRGNHDRKFTDEELLPYFEAIIPEGDGIEMEHDGIPLWVTHYPSSARADRFNIVGHIHTAWKVQLNMLNVGVDVHSLAPMPIERVRFFYDAICNFYDEDVWVAYQDVNSSFRNIRGKKGSYLETKPK